MGNRWQCVWGVSGGLLGLGSTSRPSLCWSYHKRAIFLLSAMMCKTMWCYYSLCKIHRDDTFYNLSTYVCDWSLGTHEFSAFNFILKIGCDDVCHEKHLLLAAMFGTTIMDLLVYISLRWRIWRTSKQVTIIRWEHTTDWFTHKCLLKIIFLTEA